MSLLTPPTCAGPFVKAAATQAVPPGSATALPRSTAVTKGTVALGVGVAVGVPVVAVDFGYTEVPVAALNPDRIISHFDALPGAVGELMRHPA